MFVAITTLRVPFGGCSKITLCSEVLSELCRPMRYCAPPVASRIFWFDEHRSWSLEISARPGMNTKIAPGSISVHTCSMSFAARS